MDRSYTGRTEVPYRFQYNHANMTTQVHATSALVEAWDLPGHVTTFALSR